MGLIYIILYTFTSLIYANYDNYNNNYTKGFEPNPTNTHIQYNQSTLLKQIEDSISNNQLATALDSLDTINTNMLTKKELAKYHMLRAEVFANNNVDSDAAPSETDETGESGDTSEIDQTSNQEDQKISEKPETNQATNQTFNQTFNQKSNQTQNNINYLWSNLITQQQSTLDTLKNKIISNKLNISNLSKAKIFNNSDINDQHTILGWVELASITKNIDISLSNSNNFDQQIANWQQKFVNHPAKNYINNSYHADKNSTIVVLLPLTGSLSSTANAIKQGIITAYYQDPNQQKPELIFIDTKNKPKEIQKYYDQALNYNPNFIIGPLDKSSVDTIAQNYNTPIIIALNYLSDNVNQNNNTNFFQFGISAEDEAEQAAYKAWNEGYKKALLLVDNNNQQWSERISQVYSHRYQQIAGKIANTVKIKANTNIKSMINNLLDTETSLARKKTLELVINNKLAFVPRRRQDIDHIFLVASPTIAKQIKPILKFYYADDLPVISTSNIYNYNYKTNFNNNLINDLDGITFCDIPWIIQSENNTNNTFINLNNTWKNQTNFNNNIRLYALGVDAYNLSYNLSKLTAVREIGIDSNTGHLYLDKNNKIHRLLAWAMIQDGKPKMINKLANL